MSPSVSRHRSSLVVALALCSLLAAGCSDSQGADDGGDDGGELAANARASAINVALSDLPEGYVAIPPDPDEEDGGTPVEGCVDDATDFDDVTVTDAASPTFRLQSNESLRFVASETAILADPDAAERLLDVVREAPTLSCLSDRLGEGFARLLPQTMTETPLALAPDPDFPDVGGTSLRLTGEATLTREGAEAPISISSSLVFIRTGDALSILVFGGILEPFPAETMRSVASAVAERQA